MANKTPKITTMKKRWISFIVNSLPTLPDSNLTSKHPTIEKRWKRGEPNKLITMIPKRWKISITYPKLHNTTEKYYDGKTVEFSHQLPIACKIQVKRRKSQFNDGESMNTFTDSFIAACINATLTQAFKTTWIRWKSSIAYTSLQRSMKIANTCKQQHIHAQIHNTIDKSQYRQLTCKIKRILSLLSRESNETCNPTQRNLINDAF